MRTLTWLATPIVIIAICGWYYQNAKQDSTREAELAEGDTQSQKLILEYKKNNIDRRFDRIRDGMSFEAVSKMFRLYKATETSNEGSRKTVAWTDGPYGIVVTFRNGRVVAKARQ